MSLTRKHFNMLARVMKNLRSKIQVPICREAVDEAIDEMADELTRTSPRFQRGRFIEACKEEDN